MSQIRENIWSVPQWQLESCFHRSHDNGFLYLVRRFTMTSDKKLLPGALNYPPRVVFPDAVTGKTVAGPFKIPTDVNELVYD